MLDHLAGYLSLPFVWRALAASALIACSAALLGVTLVLRRLSFMGDGLSHVAFGALAVSAALGLAGGGMALALPVTAIAAIILLRSSSRFRGDASLAMLSVTAMATGYLLMHAFPSSSNVSGDVCSTLFGSVSLLTLTGPETWLAIVLSASVILFSIFTFHKNFDIAFDEDFARVSGAKTDLFNFVSAIVTAVVIVVSMKLVGALLVSALIVFPVVIAMRMAKSFLGVTACAAALAIGLALAGILAAIVALTPVGATIVAVNAIAFLAFSVFKPRFALAAMAAVFAAFFSLCSMRMEKKDATPDIVVVSAPLADWTRNILGDATNEVSIATLQRDGTDMHSFMPSALDIKRIAACRLFIYIGGESDAWVDGVLAANPNASRTTLALLPRLPKRSGEDVHACEHHHEHEHGHEHHSLANDEHIWLSLRDAIVCVGEIAKELRNLGIVPHRPAADDAAAYIDKLQTLDREYKEHLAGKGLFIFADRFPFARLADDYDLECIAAFHGCSSDADASFDTVRHLAEEVDEHDVAAIFVIENSETRLAESVVAASGRSGIEIVEVDSMQTALRAPYLDTMRRNLAAFLSCFQPFYYRRDAENAEFIRTFHTLCVSASLR